MRFKYGLLWNKVAPDASTGLISVSVYTGDDSTWTITVLLSLIIWSILSAGASIIAKFSSSLLTINPGVILATSSILPAYSTILLTVPFCCLDSLLSFSFSWLGSLSSFLFFCLDLLSSFLKIAGVWGTFNINLTSSKAS